MLNKLLLCLLLIVVSITASAADEDLIFSYDTGNLDDTFWGTKKRERYDVAIELDKSKLNGTTLKSIEIPVNGAERMTDVKVWIASELKDNDSFDDIYSHVIDMEIDYDIATGCISHTFTSPYKVGESDKVFVGYTFSISALNAGAREPVAVVPGEHGQTYVRTPSLSNQNKWTDLGRAKGYVSCMRVVVGDAKRHLATFAEIDPLYLVSAKENIIAANIINHGAEEIFSIDYEGELAGKVFLGNANLAEPIPNIYGASRQVEIKLPPIDEGKHQLNLKLKNINGASNLEQNLVSADANVYSFLPVKRPLMEEYTANSCGYCPKGMAGIDIMKQRKGDEFVVVSFHAWSDPLAFFTDMPLGESSSLSLPTSQIDRAMTVDPYFGNNSDSFGLDKCWERKASEFTPVKIEITGMSDGFEVLFDADVTFVEPIEADACHMEFFLVGDGLTRPEWIQKNYFSKNESCRGMEGLEKYVDLPGNIRGVIYDDVVIDWTGMKGNINIPACLEYESFKASKSFVIPDIARDACLRGVVAVVDNATGAVINSDQYVVGTLGVSEIDNDSDIVETTYFNLQGLSISQAKGLCFKKELFSDGRIRVTKIIAD